MFFAICTDGTKTLLGKTAGDLGGIDEVAPHCAGSHYYHHDALTVK